MPDVYEGDKPYIFVSYCHDDDDAVLPFIEALAREGYRVWYDAGIEATEIWTEYIANHVYGCACFMAIITAAALRSHRCMEETEYAHELNKVIFPVYLEDVELTRGLQMSIGRRQAMFWHKYKTDQEFYARLFKARKIEPCLTDEGRRRRGVKAKAVRDADVNEARTSDFLKTSAAQEQSQEAEPTKVDNMPPSVGRLVMPVAPKARMADYTWSELKWVAEAIAQAEADERLGMVIRYNLVDSNGRLRGDTKPLTLTDGTVTNVRICGFRHDELADGGLSGITFEFADVPAQHRINPTDTSEGGWEASEIREWLNSDFRRRLPNSLLRCISEARKRTKNKGKVAGANDAYGVTATKDSMWLLSLSEVCGVISPQAKKTSRSPASYDFEGAQYQLYGDMGISTTNNGLTVKIVSKSPWWLRSTCFSIESSFRYIRGDKVLLTDHANKVCGVSPGFCF